MTEIEGCHNWTLIQLIVTAVVVAVLNKRKKVIKLKINILNEGFKDGIFPKTLFISLPCLP